MRPVFHPALTRTWRDETTLQVGSTPGVAVVLGGLGPIETRLLNAMDGQHDVSALRQLAVELGGDAAAADRLVKVLTSSGAVIDDARCGARDGQRTPAPDRSSVALQQTSLDGGDAALAARRGMRVDVHGAGRVGAQVARLLAAAGIGEVIVHDRVRVGAADVCPGGFGPDAVGRRRADELDRLIHADNAGPAVMDDAGQRAPAAADPDFAVLAPTASTGRDEAAELLRHGIPHLFAQVTELTGVVGPLVVPGESSCLRCHDLHRADRDRHWPLLLDTSVRRPPAAPACDVSLAATVAGLAAIQVLSHLDGFVAAAVDGTIEVTLPAGLPRRRSWRRHPGCGCDWDRDDEAAEWET